MPGEARKDIFDLFKKSGQLLFKLGVLTRALLSEVVGFAVYGTLCRYLTQQGMDS
jgi:hypothetical protein